MAVDMFVTRFIAELNVLYPNAAEFVKTGHYDPAIQTASLPAERPLFAGLCLWNHTAGYHLPSFTQFTGSYARALKRHASYENKFRRYFEVKPNEPDIPRPGLLWRLSQWYDDGMAHEYLGCALAEAYEDREKLAIVTSDPRVDFKLKADFIVIHENKSVVISCAYGQEQDRAAIERRREAQERDAKQNTAVSSHWGNKTLQAIPKLSVFRSENNCKAYKGFTLFSDESVNDLFCRIDNLLNIKRKQAMRVQEMWQGRP